MEKKFRAILTISLFIVANITLLAQNVGINTTTPLSTLDVKGSIGIGLNYAGTVTAPANGAIIEGNVGIGTTTPTAKLHIGSTFDNNNNAIVQINTENSQPLLVGSPNFNRGIAIGGGLGNEIQGRNTSGLVNNGPLLLNKSGGNVGIQNDNPASPLCVGTPLGASSYLAQFNTRFNQAVLIGSTIGYKGLMIGYDGNDIQGRSGSPNFYNNSNLLLNQYGGNVGIGTSTPDQAKLVVNGNQNYAIASYGYLKNNGTIGTNTSGNAQNYSIYASHNIAAAEFNAFSDKRIKNVIGISNNEKDLVDLMKIKITNYKMIDSISKGNKIYKKVIAQELAEILPSAVSKITDVLPNIYKIASPNPSKGGEFLAGTTFIELAGTDLKKGDRVKIIADNAQEIVEVKGVTNEGFYVPNLPSFPTSTGRIGGAGGRLFIYGKEVLDFHTVDYEALTTLNISATQALLKKINALENQVKKQNDDFSARLSTIEEMLQMTAKK